MREEILTFCHICAGHCAAKATVEDGKIVEWERDTEAACPMSHALLSRDALLWRCRPTLTV